ncbi:transglutaminase domain protein [Anaeromyxobacter sp. K]|uniref:transglutaminase-like domain-containing protein n=1 Tax=Anaeromyxobacter sp. (strain K) TaxID=447217 RepID=UPI00017BE367|nr:transglutaminase-like domain-containing protein [Anaeromyxobacter sp. K]ACG75402.1 transglutaminase domain protein [Anaeromyxobacter sp. K]
MTTPTSARLALVALCCSTSLALAACPEQRPQPVKAPPRPPQAALAAGSGDLADVLTVPRPVGPEWFGLYLVGQKAGWSKVELSRELRDGRDVLVGRSEMLLRVNVGGNTVERRQSEERVWEARAAGRLVGFKAAFSGDGGERTLTGTCAKDRCKLTVTAADGTREQELEGVAETAEMADGVRLAAARRSTVRGKQLDLLKLRVREVQHVFVRREPVAGAGVQEEVSVVEESEIGDRVAIQYKVADDGRIVEWHLGDAIVGRPEPSDRAQRLDEVDLFALGRVPLPKPLPRTVPATITYRLRGLPAAFQKADQRQRYERGPEGTTLLTITAKPPAAAEPARDTPLARAGEGAGRDDLAATPQVDSDAPAIAALAKQVAGDARGTYQAALALARWVNEHLEKAYGASNDRASDVLAARKGDCTEHAVLTVALARALGIPSRQVYGLVYARYADGKDALYWHAWAEVRSAGEWIAIDPIFGQPVADATHVALGTDKQEDAVGLLGALKVEKVDVKGAK